LRLKKTKKKIFPEPDKKKEKSFLKEFPYPHLLDIQVKSYGDFLQADVSPDKRKDIGLQRVFNEIFPITDVNENYSLLFVEYRLSEPKYTVEECRDRDMTYSVSLKALLRLVIKENVGETKQVKDILEKEVFLGELPLLTDFGTFIINGAERVIVSQLHRSPGVVFEENIHPNGQKLYSARVIPFRGSWVEFSIDINDIIYVHIDKKKKFPVTAFLRTFRYSSEEDNLEKFGGKIEEVSMDELTKEAKSDWGKRGLSGKALAQDIVDPLSKETIYVKGDLVTAELIKDLGKRGIDDQVKIFDAFKYSLNENILDEFCTRVKVSIKELEADIKKKSGRGQAEKVLAQDIIDSVTGEVIAEVGELITSELLATMKEKKFKKQIMVFDTTSKTDYQLIVNTLIKDPTSSWDDALSKIYGLLRQGDPANLHIALDQIERLFFNPKRYDLGAVGRYKINSRLGLDISDDKTTLVQKDFVEIIRYLCSLRDGDGYIDDIDHLGNRRVRTVGELISNQLSLGLSRMARLIKERMSLQDPEKITLDDLVNARTVSAVINTFFGSSQLSQFMDQTNPLAELTHKRRLSALGPGGLTRERAGFEVRDVHFSHYGRMCPIETPEGPNIGLITSLTTFAVVNEKGFIETPYRVVKNGRVTSEIKLLSAHEEDNSIIAQANAVNEKGQFQGEQVLCRKRGDFPLVTPKEIDYIDVAPDQLVSVAAALIPFLDHDDANRALMGSNMQRQAVPLLMPEAPIVVTGLEEKVAKDSGAVTICERDGIVEKVSADRIVVRVDESENKGKDDPLFELSSHDTYKLKKFQRTNQDTSINQRPLVRAGTKVKKDTILADGAATDQGELALGRNVLVAYMPWYGYNFEDAIVISEKLVKEDIFTSVHVQELETQVRDTKRGQEEITREVPNVSEESIKDLDSRGIIRIGAYIGPGDILVGKVSPKGETELSPEEKLLKAIFGDKAGDVKDSSLKVPPGLEGVVIDVKVFSRKIGVDDERDITKEEKEVRIAQIMTSKNEELEKIFEVRDRAIKSLLSLQTIRHCVDKRILKDVIKSKTKLNKKLIEELDLSGVNLDMLEVMNDQKNMEIKKVIGRANELIESVNDEADKSIEKIKQPDELPPGVIQLVKVYVAQKRKISVGDKMAGRHGNKGIIAHIVPEENMPYLPDGTPVDIILNPLGVPSRMNLGQILETHLGWAAKELGFRAVTPVFNGAREDEIKEQIRKAVYAKILKMMPNSNKKQIEDYIEEKMDELPFDGKEVLYNGRTGEPFKQKVTIGYIYMMKLFHLVEDKIHARSIGPYSLVTQQPLAGKAQFGGQRFGEMEVWAMEAYGAAHTLQEILTVKSDDVTGRSKVYEAIVKGENLPEPGVPESFNVLRRELQSLGLDVKLGKNGE
jgi:DNA-directed RNA polymerase subunit beta